jgi:peptide/nickel transport system ATP-binding protein
MARNPEHILRIENLRVEAQSGAVLVDDVSLALRRGEVLGLIGESGAGKSTIGLAALAFARAGCRITGGRILVDGSDLRSLGPAGRRDARGRRVAYVAQSAAAAFDPAMTILDQVCEGPVVHGLMDRTTARKEACALFRALDLPDPDRFGARYPHQVSGGQLQRAMAAMAMACRPDILVLDEPTTALDVTTQIEVLAQLKRLIGEHHTAALYISHDLAIVAQVADRIIVLRHGRLVETGATDQILNRPATTYARALVQERDAHDHLAVPTLSTSGPPCLEIEGVSAQYGRVAAISDITLAIARGETLAVVGESGSGKTSLARSVVGLLPRTQGSIRFLGSPLAPRAAGRSKEELRRIQLVYQQPDVALNPRQRVGDIIGRPVTFYFGRSAAAARARAAELIGLVGLPAEVIDRLPGALSGGQKQRVCIARALAAEPDLVICDEPTSALDALVGAEILELLRGLQAQLGLAYLFITHDLGIVRRMAHRTAVMLKGRIIAAGPTPEIFSPPWHPYTERLIASVPEMRIGWLTDRLAAREQMIPASPAGREDVHAR